MTAAESASAPVPAVRPRRIRFAYPMGALQRHFVDGDLVMSHIVAHLSAVFPEGEDFFVRSVRHFADQIVDPELKPRVSAARNKGPARRQFCHEHGTTRLPVMGPPG